MNEMLEKIEAGFLAVPDYMWCVFAGLIFVVIILSLFGNEFNKSISNRIMGDDE